jgi:hypothetical protein
MHCLGYRIASHTPEELVIDGRNYVAAAFLWLISTMIGLGIPSLIIWLIANRHGPGMYLSTNACLVLGFTVPLFMSVLLMPFLFFNGIVRRTIRLARHDETVTITEYISSGRRRVNTYPLRPPLKLEWGIARPRGGRVGPFWSSQLATLRDAQGKPIYLLTRYIPSLWAHSRYVKSIVGALEQWLDPRTPSLVE